MKNLKIKLNHLKNMSVIISQKDITKVATAFMLIVLMDTVSGSCLSYGHSCWGAHGKRSDSSSKDGSNEWFLSKLVPVPSAISEDGIPRLWHAIISKSSNEQLKNFDWENRNINADIDQVLKRPQNEDGYNLPSLFANDDTPQEDSNPDPEELVVMAGESEESQKRLPHLKLYKLMNRSNEE